MTSKLHFINMNNIIEIDGIRVPTGDHIGKKVFMASDHEAYMAKDWLKGFLEGADYEVRDVGAFSSDPLGCAEFSDHLGVLIARHEGAIGIALGVGEKILVETVKHPGVYAAFCRTPEKAFDSRHYNNTNCLGIDASRVGDVQMLKVVESWLYTPFSDCGEHLEEFVHRAKLEQRLRDGQL